MSQDLQHWQEQGELFAQPMDELAPTWLMEFPYLLPFGDKEVLILGGRPVRYWVGHFDRQALRFIPDVGVGRPTSRRVKRSGCTCSWTGG
jgi:hypothetical protein